MLHVGEKGKFIITVSYMENTKFKSSYIRKKKFVREAKKQ